MWEAVAELHAHTLDAADRVYRRWARARIRSGRLVGFIIDEAGTAVASGCVWVMNVQPRPNWAGTRVAYLLSMFTEPSHRGKGHATRIVRAAVSWAKARGIGVMLLHASRFGEPIYRREGSSRRRRCGVSPPGLGRLADDRRNAVRPPDDFLRWEHASFHIRPRFMKLESAECPR